MADQQTSRRRNGASSNGKGLSAREAVQRVRDDLPDLLGRPVESVLGAERGDDGEWMVTVSVVELARIPNSTDILGAYRVALAPDGELMGYRRHRRYARSQADED